MPFDPRKAVKLVANLPPREREVLKMVGQCLSHKEIAQELHVSVPTVRFYVKLLSARLNIRSTAEAVSVAIAAKMV
jgi:DNA-binding NarL/FixJ family response regulator